MKLEASRKPPCKLTGCSAASRCGSVQKPLKPFHKFIGFLSGLAVVLTILIVYFNAAGLILKALAFTLSVVFIVWGVYHVPILIAGITKIREAEGNRRLNPLDAPFLTIIIPAYHEPWVIHRAVNIALNKLVYPKDKKEIVVVTEDEETALSVLPLSMENPKHVKVLLRNSARRIKTKPAALDDVIHLTKGEIIAIFDAEDMPERNVLTKVIPLFENPQVGAVQGILRMSNPGDSWVSKMMSIEYASWFRIMLWGRNRLGLFTPLGGTCCFLRREALRTCGLWDSFNLTEDLEVSVRLAFAGYEIRLAEVRSWEEAPINVRRWLRQRSRWMRGYLQTFLQYWRLSLGALRRLGLRLSLSMFFGLVTPFVMMIVPLSYFLTVLWFITDFFRVWMPGLMTSVFPPWAIVPFLFNFIFYTGTVVGVLLETKKYSDIPWLTLLFIPYMLLHIMGVLYAGWQHLTKPVFWAKTEHYGLGARGLLNLKAKKPL